MEHHHGGSWDPVWVRRGFVIGLVNAGRNVYNLFLRRVLRRYLFPDAGMLELGCGTSTLSVALSPYAKKIVGLDNSPAALVLSKRNAESAGAHNMEFVLGDCRRVPFDQVFDFVWSNGLLEHFDDPLEIARQHFKAVRPGGTALMGVPYYYSYHNLWYRLTRPRLLRIFWLWPGIEQDFFSRRQLREIGAKITPHSRVFFLKPVILGIIFLELKK